MDLTYPFVKIYNLIHREFAYSAQIDLQGKFIPYGHSDNFPTELSQLVDGSPTATSCLSTLTDFIAGEGFNQGEDLENLVINSNGLKFLQFHNVTAGNLAHDWGVASLVKFNRVGQTTEIYDLPFGNCRLGTPDAKGIISKIHYNPYFGTSLYRAMDTVIYDVYNPAAAPTQLAEDKKFKGQIFWMGIRTKKHPFYPIPDYYAAKHWMRVEKNAGVYFDENLENGFLQDTIMKMIGDPNDPSGMKKPDGTDIPKGEAFDKEMSASFGQGAKSRHRIMALWGANKEEWPDLQPFPTAGNPDLFRIQDEHATKKITIATKVPGILANISEGVSLGGDGNTIRAAVKLMQQRVMRSQSLLVGYYQELLKNLVKPYTQDIQIVSYNPYPEIENVDPQVWEQLTPEEKRKWIKDHTEIELIDAGTPSVEEPIEPEPVENRILNLHFDSYPQKARDNVKRAIDWQEKMQKACGGKEGKKFSAAILEGKPLGPREIRRLSRFLSKNMIHSAKPWAESCEAVEFYAWGGAEMMTWANDKVKELHG